jgi:hypothetical protein
MNEHRELQSVEDDGRHQICAPLMALLVRQPTHWTRPIA